MELLVGFQGFRSHNFGGLCKTLRTPVTLQVPTRKCYVLLVLQGSDVRHAIQYVHEGAGQSVGAE